jgi:TolB-like protein
MVQVLIALAFTAKVPSIAVLDMVDLTGDQASLAKQLTQVVVTEVANDADLKVVSSGEIAQVLGYERQRELMGCKDDSCVTELAGALGVDFLMMAQLGKIGSRYRIDIRIADAKRASLLGSAGDFVANIDGVADATIHLTQKVLVESRLGRSPSNTNTASAAPNLLAPVQVASQPDRRAASAAVAPDVTAAAPPHTSAYVSWGIAGGLVVAAAAATAFTVATYNKASNPSDANYVSDAKPLAVSAPLADGLWAGALVAGGLGAYFYFTAAPATSGSGGEVGAGGRF